MLNKYNTYITNQGLTKTIFQNNKQHINAMNWNTVYDGNKANIRINTNINGKQKHYRTTFGNKKLINILKFQSINSPLDKRIQQDCLKATHISNPLRGKKKLVPMNKCKTSTDLYLHLKKNKKTKKTNNRKKRKYHVTPKNYKKSKSSLKSKRKTISIGDLL